MPQFENHGLKGGTWRGRLTDAKGQPARVILVQHAEVLAEARLTPDGENAWLIGVDLPAQVLSEGHQTLLLKTDDGAQGEGSAATGHLLARMPLLAGVPLHDDLTAEIAALRAELELVKRELRRFAAGVAGR